MRPTPKTFLLDLLSTIRRGTMPVGALVEAAALFGIPENNLRVALARLSAAERVTRDERGRYRIGPRAEPLSWRLAGWRHPERAVRPWNGGWSGVQPDRTGARRLAHGRERALRLFGLRRLAPGLFVRPDNLRLDVAGLRDALRGLGLPRQDLVFAIRDLDPETERRARGLWDESALRAGHRRLRLQLERSARRLPALSPERAMVISFLLGGEAIRRLVLDPLLPEEISPPDERDALAAAMRRYDSLGRAAWAQFLARFDVPHLENPVHTRMIGHGAAVG
ncbi:MAG: PaaX family transcriptional regulator [Candidatus Binatia bacterium]